MSMRITEGMVSRSLLTDLGDVTSRMASTQRKLSTGKEINRVSDDPFAAGRALSLSSEIEGIKQYQRNVDDATGWQNVADIALSNVGDAVNRARELVVAAASDSTGPDGRAAMAGEIDQLIESIKQEAGTTYSGRYIFSGTLTNTKPYDSGSDTYQGDSNTIAREIGQGVSIQVNLSAEDLLGNGQGAADGKLLATLRDISDHLKGGTVADADALRTTDLQALDANLDNLSSMRATVGATTNRLSTASDRLSQLEGSTTELLSNTQDADMAQAMIDFTTQQNVYQAALRSGANIIQTSLLDFLR